MRQLGIAAICGFRLNPYGDGVCSAIVLGCVGTVHFFESKCTIVLFWESSVVF
jgi:hypothetical protein